VLYERLLQRLLSARIRFFDSTPSGRILNRLSKDMQQIDQEAAPILMYFFTSVLASVAGTFASQLPSFPFSTGGTLS
jgi:ABC-type multidrug transport system fused ATPase/permease subunit